MVDTQAAGKEELTQRERRGLSLAALILSLSLGVLAGLGAYTFNFAHGLSYFSNDPQACINCHVMNDHFDSWLKSSHHGVASCNDCHTPHALLPKLLTKAENGWNHSVAFTNRKYEREPIVITPRNAARLRHNCIECHSGLLSEVRGSNALLAGHHGPGGQELDCLRCHSDAGHGARK